MRVNTWGHGWPEGRLSAAEMVEVFSASKVNLSFSSSSTRRNRFSPAPSQIKGRVFEVPGCGGLLLTEYAPGLEGYYTIGKEIVCFAGRRELLSKVRWLLSHDEERSSIARAGLLRTLRDHTYERRLTEIFQLATSGASKASGRTCERAP